MNRRLAIANVVALFVLGILIGALGMRLISDPGPGESPRPGGRGGLMRHVLPERFMDELELSPDQRARIDTIVEESRRDARAFHEEMLPRVEAMMQRSRDRIAEVLTPEQRERFDEHVESMRHRRHDAKRRRQPR